MRKSVSQSWPSSYFEKDLQFHPEKKVLRIKKGKKNNSQSMEEFLFTKHFSRLGLISLGKRSEEFPQRNKPGTVAPCSLQCKVGSLMH